MDTTQTACLKFLFCALWIFLVPRKITRHITFAYPCIYGTHISISLTHLNSVYFTCTFDTYVHLWLYFCPFVSCCWFYIFILSCSLLIYTLHLYFDVYSIFLLCYLVRYCLSYSFLFFISIYVYITIISFNDFESCLLFYTCVKTYKAIIKKRKKKNDSKSDLVEVNYFGFNIRHLSDLLEWATVCQCDF